jgi:uncharacterized protein YecE (DUF72 family)
LSLEEYSDRFEVIEVQSTFYRLPSINTANKWRQRAKRGFKFTVKAFQGVTHPISSPTWRKAGNQKPKERAESYGLLKPNEQNFKCWDNTVKICKALDAKVCVVQLPPSFKCNRENVGNMVDFFKGVDKPLSIAIEVRHKSWYDDPNVLKQSLESINAIHIIDPLIRKPVLKSEEGYYRLHGLGKRLDYRYQYSDNELLRLLKEIRGIGCSESFAMFNNMAMCEDAIRFRRLVKDGSPPPLEGRSLEKRLKVILKGILFPVKARELSEKRGHLLVRANSKTFTLTDAIKRSNVKVFNSFKDLLELIEG